MTFAIKNRRSRLEKEKFQFFIQPDTGRNGEWYIYPEYYNKRDKNPYNADFCLIQTPTSIIEKSRKACPRYKVENFRRSRFP